MMIGPWGALEVGPGECAMHSVGGVTFWARASEDEWQIAHQHREPDGEPGDSDSARDELMEVPEDLDWTRFVTIRDDRVSTRPALPDRAVVIRPKSPIVILPERWGRFYFSVPLWIQFVSGSMRRSAVMLEVPTQRLSSTWFGSMEGGDLCYAVGSRLLRTVAPTAEDAAFARCEIEIRNGSRERLQFERICVHVEYMHLYEARGTFWSNPVRVVFKGADQVSQVSYLPGPSQMVAGEAVEVCPPRETLDKNIFKRSFNLIREITGI